MHVHTCTCITKRKMERGFIVYPLQTSRFGNLEMIEVHFIGPIDHHRNICSYSQSLSIFYDICIFVTYEASSSLGTVLQKHPSTVVIIECFSPVDVPEIDSV